MLLSNMQTNGWMDGWIATMEQKHNCLKRDCLHVILSDVQLFRPRDHLSGLVEDLGSAVVPVHTPEYH